ncbi:MAG: YdcF family protein [Verrucomicrobia subdivision 3 bacterium]|nr:YdcF family protein [Limisphaerales bacterium]
MEKLLTGVAPRMKPGFAHKPRRRWLRFALIASLPFLLAPAAIFAGLYWSESLLISEHSASPADVIVVLGGEWVYRRERAMQLYQQRLAPRLIISGEGDSADIRNWLVAKEVPETVIRAENNSASTKENAEFTIRLLRQQKARRVIIVTSWFHSLRALACFQKAAPEMKFISLPTVADRPGPRWPNEYERRVILREYAKLAWYWLRYGVPPLTR